MHWQRRMLALFGALLPILSPLFGFLAYSKNGPHFWWSISATFYATSNILMIGVLWTVAYFLWTYKGYDIGDSISCKLAEFKTINRKIIKLQSKCIILKHYYILIKHHFNLG